MITTVWRRVFQDDQHRLVAVEPVRVELEHRVAEGWLAHSAELHCWAHGDTSDAALQDLDAQVVYLYYHYRDLPHQRVIGLAARLKPRYCQLFCEEP